MSIIYFVTFTDENQKYTQVSLILKLVYGTVFTSIIKSTKYLYNTYETTFSLYVNNCSWMFTESPNTNLISSTTVTWLI